MVIKMQHFEVEGASEDGVRKRRKVVPSPELESVEKTISTYKEGAFESEARRKLHDAQKSLHLSLKPEILKLCKILKFSDDAEGVVEEFLEYVMNNHHVSREPTSIFEAFQISLCWTVASMLKQKIDRKESVALAQQHLNFKCSKDEADSVYSRLRSLKRTFSNRTGKLKVADSPSSNEQRLPSPLGLEMENKLAPDGVPMSIKEIQKKFRKKLNKLIQKQQEEKNGMLHSFEEEKVRIEERKRTEIAVIHSCFKNNTSMRMDKLRSLDISCAKEFEELENQMHTCLKKLEVEQLAAKRNIQEREAQCIDAMKSWDLGEFLGKRPSSEPDDYAGEVALRAPQTNSSNDGVNNIASENVYPPASEEQIYNGLSVNCSEKDVQLGVPETIGTHDDLGNLVLGDGPLLKEQVPDAAGVSVSGEIHLRMPETTDSSAGLENLVSGSGLSEEQVPNTSAVSVSGEVCLGAPETIGSSDSLENLVPGSGALLMGQIPDTNAVSVPITDMEPRVLENASSGDGEAIGSSTQMLLAEHIPDTATLTVPSGKIGLAVPDAACDEVEVSQAREDNGETQIALSNGMTCMNQQDGMRNAVNENSLLQELSQAQEDECALPSMSSGMQLGDVRPCDEQNAAEEVEYSMSQPVETALSNQPHHEAMVCEPAAQGHLSLTSNSPSGSNALDVLLVGEVSNLPSREACTFNAAEELVANPPHMLNQPVSQPSTSYPIQSNGIPIGASEMHFSDLRTSTAPEFNNCPAQSLHARPSLPPRSPNLFLLESERLCKEFGQTLKDYEDKKLLLQSECDKEISQIRLKYEIKQQEVDVEYLTEKEDFAYKYNKVWMNIILAYAFSIKSMELRSSDPSGTRQEALITSIRQLILPFMQEHGWRPPAVASTSMISSAAASLQTLAPEPNLQTPIPAQIIAPCTTLPPPVQGVSPPSALSTSAIVRPPHIVSLSYSNGNQGSAQIRAPPPHLRSSASRALPAFPNTGG